jgi:hypothetical protein
VARAPKAEGPEKRLRFIKILDNLIRFPRLKPKEAGEATLREGRVLDVRQNRADS